MALSTKMSAIIPSWIMTLTWGFEHKNVPAIIPSWTMTLY
jgi:hypothetical protein